MSTIDASSDPDASSTDTDAGNEIDAATSFETAVEWSLSGAQTGSFSYTDDVNYISCVSDASGFFAISASAIAGGSEGFDMAFYDYAGPGTYELLYTTGGGGPSGDVNLPGGYRYWFFYNRSSVDFSMVPSMCTLVITGVSGSDSRIEGTLSCSGLVANITSPDYDDEDAAGFRPSVALTAQFSCEL